MRDIQYFSKLRDFLSGKRGRNIARGATRRLSPFKIESLEARVLLSADLGVALSVAEILNSPTVGNQQAVVQNVQVSQSVVASTSTTPALMLNGGAAPRTIAPGGTMTVKVVNPTGNAHDWIGIYQVGQSSSTKSVVEHYVGQTDYTDSVQDTSRHRMRPACLRMIPSPSLQRRAPPSLSGLSSLRRRRRLPPRLRHLPQRPLPLPLPLRLLHRLRQRLSRSTGALHRSRSRQAPP